MKCNVAAAAAAAAAIPANLKPFPRVDKAED